MKYIAVDKRVRDHEYINHSGIETMAFLTNKGKTWWDVRTRIVFPEWEAILTSFSIQTMNGFMSVTNGRASLLLALLYQNQYFFRTFSSAIQVVKVGKSCLIFKIVIAIDLRTFGCVYAHCRGWIVLLSWVSDDAESNRIIFSLSNCNYGVDLITLKSVYRLAVMCLGGVEHNCLIWCLNKVRRFWLVFDDESNGSWLYSVKLLAYNCFIEKFAHLKNMITSWLRFRATVISQLVQNLFPFRDS